MKMKYLLFATLAAVMIAGESLAGSPAADWLSVGAQNVELGYREPFYGDLTDFFEVESGSTPTIKVSGLPSGIKYDAKTGVISGSATKQGVFYVTCSVSNPNKYKQTAIGVWTVGDASNGDYDNIGIDWDHLENLEEEGTYDETQQMYVYPPVVWRTGEKVSFSISNAFFDDSGDVTGLTVSGLPPTLKAPKCSTCAFAPGTYSGTLTKAGKYTVNVTAKYWGGGTAKARKTIIVEDAGSRYVSVVSPSASRGSVTGSGVYAVGASAKISAKPARGYYFAGWYGDPGFEEPFYDTASGGYQKASDSFVVRDENPAIYAKFISRDEDEVYFDADDRWEVATCNGYDDFYFYVYSETAAKVTAKGLPSGMKFIQDIYDESCRVVCSDTSKLKPGASDVVFTAMSATGAVATYVLRIVIPNLQSWAFNGLDYSDTAYRLTLGVSDACMKSWMRAEYDDFYTISASGLPPGLKISARNGELTLHGTPTKAGTYTVTLNAKSRWETEKATITITVDPLPDYTIGTFNGVLVDEDMDDQVAGLVTLTATANGKISAKIVSGRSEYKVKTYSYSSNGWNCEEDGSFDAYFYKSSTDEYGIFTLKPEYEWNDAAQMTGYFSIGGKEYSVKHMQRDPVKAGVQDAKDIAASLSRAGTFYLVGDPWGGELRYPESGESSDIQLKVNKTTGEVSLAGKFYGSSSFSGKAPLMFDEEGAFVVFYMPVSVKMCTSCCGSEYHCSTERVYYPFTFRF